jgi:putative thioredoxin
VLERLAAEAAGRWELAKVDTEQLPEVATRYGVQSIPNVKLFVNGRVVDEFVGALSEAQAREWLRAALPSPRAAELARAMELLERGSFARAVEALRPVVAEEPDNVAARLALGRALLHMAPAEVGATVAGLELHDDPTDRVAALVTLAHAVALADASESLPDSPLRPRLVEAMRAVRAGDWAAALEALIAIVRQRHDPLSGRARELGRAIFVLLGFEHPACERYHRAFSSAMNV